MPTQFTEEHYRTLFESIDLGFCTIEVLFDHAGHPVDYRFLDVNRAFEQQTGLRDAVGRRMRELAPQHEEHWFQTYGRVALTGEAVRFEHGAAALGRWYEVYAFRVSDPAQRRVAILFTDVAARKRAEEALHASETRYRALAHATSNSLFRISADGVRLLEVSGGRVTPHESANVPSSSWLEDYVHPEDLARTREAWTAAVASQRTYELEHRALFADGSTGWVLSRAVAVRNDAGAVVEWIGSATDITARKDAEEALRRSQADHEAARLQAERANRAKDEFLAMLGHELRNPLSPMLTALQLMRLRGIASREQEVLERQVTHLTRLVDDLLDVSRIARGHIELRRRPIEFGQVVVRAMELVGPLVEQRRNLVTLDVPEQGLGIDADPDSPFALAATATSFVYRSGTRASESPRRCSTPCSKRSCNNHSRSNAPSAVSGLASRSSAASCARTAAPSAPRAKALPGEASSWSRCPPSTSCTAPLSTADAPSHGGPGPP